MDKISRGSHLGDIHNQGLRVATDVNMHTSNQRGTHVSSKDTCKLHSTGVRNAANEHHHSTQAIGSGGLYNLNSTVTAKVKRSSGQQQLAGSASSWFKHDHNLAKIAAARGSRGGFSNAAGSSSAASPRGPVEHDQPVHLRGGHTHDRSHVAKNDADHARFERFSAKFWRSCAGNSPAPAANPVRYEERKMKFEPAGRVNAVVTGSMSGGNEGMAAAGVPTSSPMKPRVTSYSASYQSPRLQSRQVDITGSSTSYTTGAASVLRSTPELLSANFLAQSPRPNNRFARRSIEEKSHTSHRTTAAKMKEQQDHFVDLGSATQSVSAAAGVPQKPQTVVLSNNPPQLLPSSSLGSRQEENQATPAAGVPTGSSVYQDHLGSDCAVFLPEQQGDSTTATNATTGRNGDITSTTGTTTRSLKHQSGKFNTSARSSPTFRGSANWMAYSSPRQQHRAVRADLVAAPKLSPRHRANPDLDTGKDHHSGRAVPQGKEFFNPREGIKIVSSPAKQEKLNHDYIGTQEEFGGKKCLFVEEEVPKLKEVSNMVKEMSAARSSVKVPRKNPRTSVAHEERLVKRDNAHEAATEHWFSRKSAHMMTTSSEATATNLGSYKAPPSNKDLYIYDQTTLAPSAGKRRASECISFTLQKNQPKMEAAGRETRTREHVDARYYLLKKEARPVNTTRPIQDKNPGVFHPTRVLQRSPRAWR